MFTFAHGSLAMSHPMSTSVTKLGTQLACREARKEYLFNNPKFLITYSRGKIRYHPDQTVIFIINWDNMGFGIADKITEHLLAGLPVDEWVSEIKRLAVRCKSLKNDMRHVTLMTGIQQLIAVEEPPRKGWLVNNADYQQWLKWQKQILEETTARIAPDFKVPRLSFLEQDKVGERWYHGV